MGDDWRQRARERVGDRVEANMRQILEEDAPAYLQGLPASYSFPTSDEEHIMLASLIRTVVPFIVGFLLTWAGKAGLDIHADTTITDAVTVLVGGAYYLVARLLEQAWPQFGRILLAFGLTKAGQPQYVRTARGPATRLPRV